MSETTPTVPLTTSWTGRPRPTGTGTSSNSSGNLGYGGSPMYLFTFIAVLVVLVFVACALLLRAVHVRRRYRRQLQRALERGERPPPYPFVHGRVTRVPKVLPPMPRIWDGEMGLLPHEVVFEDEPKKGREGEKDARGLQVETGGWGETEYKEHEWSPITPVSIAHVLEPLPSPSPPNSTPPHPDLHNPHHVPGILTDLREALYDLVPWSNPRRRRREREAARAARAAAAKVPQEVKILPPEIGTAPDAGETVCVGVLIAMPCEREAMARWYPADPIEADLPEVCLGVMDCVVGPGDGGDVSRDGKRVSSA